MKVICTERQKEMIIDNFSDIEGNCLIGQARQAICGENLFDCKKCLRKNIEWEIKNED